MADGESKRYPSGKVVRFFICQCECGNTHITNVNALRSGDTRSCGCLAKEGNNFKHGMTRTKFWHTWVAMRQRAGKIKYWKHVTVSTEWESFDRFYLDMYKPYLTHVAQYGETNTTIDRVDNTKGYTRSNCRWATTQVQNKNKRKHYTVKELWKSNNSGHKYIYFTKKRKRWVVRIPDVCYRYFKTKEEAVEYKKKHA